MVRFSVFMTVREIGVLVILTQNAQGQCACEKSQKYLKAYSLEVCKSILFFFS